VSKVDGLPFASRTETTHVHVSSPRFTMPTDQILSTFPPANGEGAFGNRLPQVVLKRRTLPWERNPMGGDQADEAHPWLALVVVAEGEGELSSATPVEQCVSADAHLDTSDRDVDQSVYLAVTETVLKRIFPCEEDLPMLTHVRRVDVKSALDGAAAQVAAPKASQWATTVDQVSAVALDPDAQLLVRDAMSSGWRIPISKIALEPVHRFPVLAYWSFTTTEGSTFMTLMQGLDYGLLGTRDGERINPPADPPEPPPHPQRPEVMETGHIHLDHRTRRGDRTQAWYRGPLVPHPTLRDAPPDPDHPGLPLAHASDQLRRVVPEGGEDLSYAAAFEIGRLLALSQLSIVSALLRFRGV